MEPLGLIIIILTIYFLYVLSNRIISRERTSQGIEYLTQDDWEEWERYLQADEQFINAISSAIMDSYTIPRCSRCNDKTHKILQFNLDFTGMKIECETCAKSIWLTSDLAGGEKIKEAYDTYYAEDIREDDPTDSLVLYAAPIPKQSDLSRHSIPKKVKQEVWQRDGGKCVECSSKENLEYDHIIPISKGGSNTARNIQLLCESCNRKKSGKIE